MQITYPDPAEAGASGLCLNASQERQVKVLGEDQQQHSLHPLRSGLQTERNTQIHESTGDKQTESELEEKDVFPASS